MAHTRNRDYRKEYLRDHAHKEAKDNRVKRNFWNRKIKTPPGKEIDHKVPLSKGGGNGRENLRVVSVRENRSKGVKTASRYQAFSKAVDSYGVNAYLTAQEKDKLVQFAQEERERLRRLRYAATLEQWRKNNT